MLDFRLFPRPGDTPPGGFFYAGISTGLPSAYSTTVSSPGAMRWPQNSRNSSGLVLSTFAMRRGFIGMPSASFWSSRNSRTGGNAEIRKPKIGGDHGGDAAPHRRVMLVGQ